MSEAIYIELLDLSSGVSSDEKLKDVIYRVPQERNGYQLIRYNGRRYVLRGGIRTNHFISLNNPLKFGERVK